MQNWEYCGVEVTIGDFLTGVQGKVTFFKPDGKHIEKKEKPGTLLAQLGQDGWDLVAASARIESGLGSKHKIDYMLKRPISG